MSEKSYNLNGLDMDEAGVTDLPKGAKDVGTDSAQVNMSSKSSQVDNKGLSGGNGTLASAKDLHPGDIIIKAEFEDTIKCVSYNNQEPTFMDLLKLLERMFKKAFKATDDNIVLKYKDNDGDYVTIDDTDDVCFAIRTCHGLNIRVTRVEPEEPENKKPLKVSEKLFSEVTRLRMQVEDILDRMICVGDDEDGPGIVTLKKGLPQKKISPEEYQINRNVLVADDSPATISGVQVVPPPMTGSGATEFDPLNGVSTMDDRRHSTASSVVSQKSVSTDQVNKVIESFQPSSRESHSPSVGVSSNSTTVRAEPPKQQTNLQSSATQIQTSQTTNSLFDYGRGTAVKPGVAPSQTSQAAQFQVGTAPAPGTPQQQAPTQPSIPPQTMYGPQAGVAQSVPPQQTAPSPYSHSNQYQYQAGPNATYPGVAAQGYPSLPTSTAPTANWNDPNSNQQANSYMNMQPQMNPQVPPQQSQMPSMPSQPQYARPQQPPTPVYGQMGAGQTHPAMGPGQGAPPMGVQTPTMGAPPQMPGAPPQMAAPSPMGAPPPMASSFRPGAPPPSVGAPPAGGGANPYSRAGVSRYGM